MPVLERWDGNKKFMIWMLFIFMIGTEEIVVQEHGFRSLQYCEKRAQAYMKNLDSDKYMHVCMYEGDPMNDEMKEIKEGV